MSIYQWISLICMGTGLFALLRHAYNLFKTGKPVDYSLPAGEIRPGIQYAFTGAMNPTKKESAFLHLPTYTAGIIYHLGSFLALFLFLLFICQVPVTGWFSRTLIIFLLISAGCGLGILAKRLLNHHLRTLSNPDDYLSNILTSFFHLATCLVLFNPAWFPGYYIFTAVLWLYFPLGKLKHALYFFVARYHLGFFYGRRGVWPPKQY